MGKIQQLGLSSQNSSRLEDSRNLGTRGRVRAGPSLQLGTLSTRIALYTRRWRTSRGLLTHADYTLGAVAPLLTCLRTAHILGPGGSLPHAKNEVDRTTRSGDMAKPSADRLTRDTRQTDTSYYRQPTNQPASRPFCQYPAVSWEFLNSQDQRTVTTEHCGRWRTTTREAVNCE